MCHSRKPGLPALSLPKNERPLQACRDGEYDLRLAGNVRALRARLACRAGAQVEKLSLMPEERAVDLVATEFTSVVFRILHYRNAQRFRVVQNPENHRNESGGG